MKDGIAAQMLCTVLPLQLTVHLLPKRHLFPRWLPTNNVKELTAQVDAVHMKDGIAAQMGCTVLPLLLTVHLLPKRHLFPRWLPTSNVKVLTAQVVCTVRPLQLTVHLLPKRHLFPRWLPTRNVTCHLNAQVDAVHMQDGCAAQMECTVLQH